MFDPLQVPARQLLEADDARLLQKTGTLIVDERRRRTRFFDGRLFTARDCTREQTYFLTRQATLAQSGGAGVVQGLLVERETATSLGILPGHGITPTGEAVVIPHRLHVSLENLAEMQRLDAAFGLLKIPREPSRNRSGLYVLALRAVEFTANAVSSYPMSITGSRAVEDGDIVEGTAVTLIPYPDEGARDEMNLRRSRVALDIFVHRGTAGLPATALPLAIIALDRGVVQWVDPYLVRRELGATQGDPLGLGMAPRALREAHLQHYHQYLNEILDQRNLANRGQRFAASEYFFALPASGRMPAAAVDTQNFTQIYFPPEVAVDLALVPEDELPALLEESLLLPPIDLTLSADEQGSTAVLALRPVPRPQFRSVVAKLTNVTQRLRPAAPGLVARRAPLESLLMLRMPSPALPVLQPEGLVDAAWREVLAGSSFLWYVRRRNLSSKAEVGGDILRLASDEAAVERDLNTQLTKLALQDRFAALRARATGEAAAEMVRLLSTPKINHSRTVLDAVLRELDEARVKRRPDGPPMEGPTPVVVGPRIEPPETGTTLNRAAVLRVAERYADPQFGEGLQRLENKNAKLRDDNLVSQNLAQSGAVPQLDRLGRLLPETDLVAVAAAVETAARAAPAKVAELVQQKLKEIEP